MNTTLKTREQRARPVEAELVTNSQEDARETLDRLKRLAHLMDEAFTIPGTNFKVGWDSIIGLVPVLGDVAGAAVSVYIIAVAKRLGVSRWCLFRMISNVTFDAVVGIVPLAGDAADAVWKANSKNLKLLENQIDKQERRVKT